jgi:transposase-like protein
MKPELMCPHCTNMDYTMLEHELTSNRLQVWWCMVCGKNFHVIVESNEPKNKGNEDEN